MNVGFTYIPFAFVAFIDEKQIAMFVWKYHFHMSKWHKGPLNCNKTDVDHVLLFHLWAP